MEEKEAKFIIKLGEVTRETQKMYPKFVQNQCVLEIQTQEWEKLRQIFDKLALWVNDKLDGMQYEDCEEKGCRGEEYLLMLRYMFHQIKTLESRTE